MKETGIVRRIDELGRVVIPKELRRTQHIRQGDALEIYTGADGELVLKKYSPLAGFRDLAQVYAEVLARECGGTVLICDRDEIVALGGPAREYNTGMPVPAALQKQFAARTLFTLAPEAVLRNAPETSAADTVLCAAPLLVRGDLEGGIGWVGSAEASTREKVRAISLAAAFLARWMEE
jgi:AbrB family transcriptional regulator (stage V sporulation protein T)